MINKEDYWNARYENQETGWDIGYAAPAICEYVDQLENKNIKILIPGCGRAYEAEYLFKQGFTQVYPMDFSENAMQEFLDRTPDFPADQWLSEDFFEHEGQYDLILEQTFFCALHPSERPHYIEHMLKLLKPGGHLAGLLFNIPLFSDHPPYGGAKEEYIQQFEPHLQLKTIEACTNSIPPRDGSELFINFIKPKA